MFCGKNTTSTTKKPPQKTQKSPKLKFQIFNISPSKSIDQHDQQNKNDQKAKSNLVILLNNIIFSQLPAFISGCSGIAVKAS